MTDLFFSYSSKDRDRVRPICEALLAQGFEVFWDQNIPAGSDWDSWIKEQLAGSRCAIVFWSRTSVSSNNVRHEATVAMGQGKLVPVMLDELRVDQFPMGLFSTQAARLINWSGSDDDPEWQKLLSEIENKATPAWVGRRLAKLDAALRAETKRRDLAEANEDAVQAQLDEELTKHAQLRRERERAQSDAGAARAVLVGLKEALDSAKAQNEELTARAGSVERLEKAARIGAPIWALLIGIGASLAAGAGGTYFLLREEVRTVEGARAEFDAMAQTDRERRADLDAREKEARDRAASLETREKDLADRESAERRRRTDLEAREKSEQTRRAQLEAGDKSMRERDAAEAQRRAEINLLQAELKKARDSLAAFQAREDAERKRREEAQRPTTEAERKRLAERPIQLRKDTGLVGDNIPPSLRLRSALDCRTACQGMAECKGFQFTYERQTCDLYSVIKQQISDRGVDAGWWD